MFEGVAWPLTDEHRVTVARLGELVRRFGSARLLLTHVVRADQRDFPERWEPTLPALYRLLYRLFWHAHIDAEVVVEDLRDGREQPNMLTNSAIDFLEARTGRATFQVAAIGNDDVAGLLSHAIGAAFLALQPPDPFREATAAATETDASIAACYLGLGVLVANSSMYQRHRSQVVGRQVRTEQRIETTGGLSIADATLLLAVQLVVRDDVPGAVATLHGAQKDWVDRWIEVLDPHEDELRALLGLDATGELPSRAAEPRTPPPVEEPARKKSNEGRVSFRTPRRRHRMWLGLGVGFAAAIGARLAIGESVALLAALPAGAIGGRLITRPGFRCFSCHATMPSELPVCPVCGVTLRDTLATKAERKARLAEWADQAEAAVDPEHLEAAESAYHPDV